MSESIFLGPLESAIQNLEDILRQPMDEYRRDGVIQRFEYTFELCWKALQRKLEEDGVPCGSPKQTIRQACEAGIIQAPDKWFEFLKARNLSVHTYNRKVAEEVYRKSIEFVPFAMAVLNQLQKK